MCGNANHKDQATVVFIFGTRPEIIKLSPLIRECEKRPCRPLLLHTGQHYSEDLDSVFFEQLNLPDPDYNLEIGSGSHGKQTGRMVEMIEKILLSEDPEYVIVQGDTNSTLSGGLAASKLNCDLCHVEAGLRSFNDEMPEETNRVLTDHISDYLFPPTCDAEQNLIDENISKEKIWVTGNTIVDAVNQNIDLSKEKSDILDRMGVEQDQFILLTAHRSENVDDPNVFSDILEGVASGANNLSLPVIYPIHPRARKMIGQNDINIPNQIKLYDPLNFLDFLMMENAASLVVTDSGGVQEEACILKTPCVTIRTETERPETVQVNANTIGGIEPSGIAEAITKMHDKDANWKNPFGDGTASKQILNIIFNE